MNARPVTQTELYHHVVKHILATEVFYHPFNHMLFPQPFFPPVLYDLLIKNLPDKSLYSAMGKDNTRSQFKFIPENQARLQGDAVVAWLDVLKVLNEPGFKQTVFGKLAAGVSERFNFLDVDCDIDVRLMRDVAGYYIAPHRDTLSKIITMQVYLPETKSPETLYFGTSFYELDHANKFIEYGRVPYLPNSGYAFTVSDSPEHASWHGVEKIPDTFKGVRNSLLIMFQQKGD